MAGDIRGLAFGKWPNFRASLKGDIRGLAFGVWPRFKATAPGVATYIAKMTIFEFTAKEDGDVS